jgi:nucleoside-diphosphate-sugar epimerase
MKRVLVIGSSGQIGTELVVRLRDKYGSENVVASDIKSASDEVVNGGPFEMINVLDAKVLKNVINRYQIEEVYLLAAMLSAVAEQKPMVGWGLNMDGLFNLLELAKDGFIKKLFWPSSIAVFGPTTPRDNTPQSTIMEPSTVYGISKLAGERWCEYYHDKYGVDVRSIRYPGLIGYKSAPGGGTTDYAVSIFHDAVNGDTHECFLSANASLPMMYMEDAIDATLSIMEAPEKDVKIRSSYNIAGISFSPEEIYEAIKARVPEVQINYVPDFRDEIAASWPKSIDDSAAKQDWGWKPKYDLKGLVEVMLDNLQESQLS